jgi:glutamyl-Q tRNA(Asp) synthetase
VVTNSVGEKLSKQTGAQALNPRGALSALHAAARHLGLGEVGADSVEHFWARAIPLWAALYPLARGHKGLPTHAP